MCIYICVCTCYEKRYPCPQHWLFQESTVQPPNVHPRFTQGYQWLAPIPPGPFLIGTAFGDHHILPAELKKKEEPRAIPTIGNLSLSPSSKRNIYIYNHVNMNVYTYTYGSFSRNLMFLGEHFPGCFLSPHLRWLTSPLIVVRS